MDDLKNYLSELSRRIPKQDIPQHLALVEEFKARLYYRLAEPGDTATRPDRLLEVKEAAEKLGQTADWLYRHNHKLPFIVRLGRNIRFSEQGIEKFIRQRAR